MDWTLLHALNDFLFRHDQVEDPLLFYVNASEALFIVTLAVVFLLAHGRRHLDWRRATVAAVLSAGLGLAVAKLLSELVDSGPPVRRGPPGGPPVLGPCRRPRLPSDHATAAFAIADGDLCCASAEPGSRPSVPRRCCRSAGSLWASTTRVTSSPALRWAARPPWLSGSIRRAAGWMRSRTSSAHGGTGRWAGAPNAPGSPGAPRWTTAAASKRDH